MTISAADRRAGPYDGNGSNVNFTFAFDTSADTEVRVIVLNETTLVETDAVLGSDYSVTINPDQSTSPGGTVVFNVAPTTNQKVTLLGKVNYDQTADLPTGGQYRAEVVEQALDRTVKQVQQIKEEIDRAVKVSASSTATPDDLMADINAAAAATAASAIAAAASETAAGLSEVAADASAIAAAASETAAGLSEVAADASAAAADASASAAAAAGTAAGTAAANAVFALAAPPGEVAFFAGSTAPSGWLKANGALISRATYATLFAAIGTTFGVGDGTTTFNLPDLRGEFIRGWDDGRGVDTGRAIGSAQGSQMQSHGHTISAGDYLTNSGSYLAGGSSGTFSLAPSVLNGVTGSSNIGATGGTSNSSENRPRNIALLACIKY